MKCKYLTPLKKFPCKREAAVDGMCVVHAGKQSASTDEQFIDPEKRIADLESALRPFVDAYNKHADPIGDSDLDNEQPRAVYVELGDCRKAARVMKDTP